MWYETVIKLLLAIGLSGIIGFERENMNRPAGLRTHVLVCVGAAIVQITSLQFYAQVIGAYSADAFRLGAQVISGIGFLGAGTIIKEGSSIKGLTTAASLWAVACIGLTVGTGLYKEAVFATLAVFLTLKGLRFAERLTLKHKRAITLQLEMYNSSEKVMEVLQIMANNAMNIQHMTINNTGINIAMVELTLTYEKEIDLIGVLKEVSLITGVKNAEFEK
ncbi:MAG: MgtC/SapB family protein [Lachnospiraceae bacterium]|nr:MgtC/SapB family protein [Lachnospiraceae bacterium]